MNINEQHEYDPVTQNCSCGAVTRNDSEEMGWKLIAGNDPQRSEALSRLWHIGHRAELGLPYDYEKIESGEPCPACFTKNPHSASYVMVSGDTRVALCEHSAREYGIIFLQKHKMRVPDPLKPECECCKGLNEELWAKVESVPSS